MLLIGAAVVTQDRQAGVLIMEVVALSRELLWIALSSFSWLIDDPLTCAARTPPIQGLPVPKRLSKCVGWAQLI